MATLQKSRTRRLKFRKRQGSKPVRILLSNTIPKSRCTQCSNILHGIAAVTRKQLKKLNRSQKRSQRQHPEMCSACSRRAIINAVRSSAEDSPDSIDPPKGRIGLLRETRSQGRIGLLRETQVAVSGRRGLIRETQVALIEEEL